MLKYCDSTNLSKHFGDFGGNDSVSETDFKRLNPDVEQIRRILESAPFETEFRKILPAAGGCSLGVKKYYLKDGRVLYSAPSLAKRYNLAGQLALALLRGYKSVFIGTSLKEIALAAAGACSQCGLDLQIMLSRELSRDSELIRRLEEQGARVDAVTCTQYLDLAYSSQEQPFLSDPPYYVVSIEANYGIYPKPALTGVLAGLFGADLMDELGQVEACVVPITTGTEAIGVFKALVNTPCKLATSEQLIAQEFHIIDADCYTISTRSSNNEQENTSLCPELVNWWRQARVRRLGCDRLYNIDTGFLDFCHLSPTSARSAALALAAIECRELLVLEEEK